MIECYRDNILLKRKHLHSVRLEDKYCVKVTINLNVTLVENI